MCLFFSRLLRVVSLLVFSIAVYFFFGALATFIDVFGISFKPEGVNSTLTPSQSDRLSDIVAEVYRTGQFPYIFRLVGGIATAVYIFLVLLYLLWSLYKTGNKLADCCEHHAKKQERRARRKERYQSLEPIREESSPPESDDEF